MSVVDKGILFFFLHFSFLFVHARAKRVNETNVFLPFFLLPWYDNLKNKENYGCAVHSNTFVKGDRHGVDFTGMTPGLYSQQKARNRLCFFRKKDSQMKIDRKRCREKTIYPFHLHTVSTQRNLDLSWTEDNTGRHICQPLSVTISTHPLHHGVWGVFGGCRGVCVCVERRVWGVWSVWSVCITCICEELVGAYLLNFCFN